MLGKSMALGTLGAIALAVSIQAAAAETPTIDQLPAAIKPTGMSVYLETAATGAQVYTCSKNASGAWAWTLKGPDAELFDMQKKPVGKHYAGPTWEGGGGKVVAAATASAPAPGGNAVPWLLLDVKSHEGTGEISQAKAVLRVSTSGGVAPGQGCDEAHSGQETRVPYTATYLFLK